MGRAPLKMELIRNEKRRQSTFQQRKKSLFKKAGELSKLCDVKAGIIIYGLESDDEPEIWHSNPDDVQKLITHYKNQPIDQKNKRTTDLSILYEDRKNKSETALSKLRKQNNETQYPTWNNMFDDFSEEQLRELARGFDAKLEAVKARFDLLKGNYHEYMEFDQGFARPQPLDQDQRTCYEYDYSVPNLNLMHNDMMMALMNNSIEFGDASYCSDPLPPLDGGELFYNYDKTMIGRMAMNNAAPLMCYNEPIMKQHYNTGIAGPSNPDDLVALLMSDRPSW